MRKSPDGRTSHPLYRTWKTIKTRCYNENSRGWSYYGARGIRMYGPWIDDARAFIDWIEENLGPRPEGHTLDRINNDGNYEPGNLKWSTTAEQRRNRKGWGKSGVRGVYRHHGKKWVAQITVNGESIKLGSYDTPEEASAAYEGARLLAQCASMNLTDETTGD